MEALRLLAGLILVSGLTGCGYVIETVAGQVFGQDARGPGLEAPAGQLGVDSKAVADKTPPTTLVARDGSTCQVPRVRFDYIRIGQTVVCVWTSASYRAMVRPRY